MVSPGAAAAGDAPPAPPAPAVSNDDRAHVAEACPGCRSTATAATATPSADATQQPVDGRGRCPVAAHDGADVAAATAPTQPAARCPVNHAARHALVRAATDATAAPAAEPTASVPPGRDTNVYNVYGEPIDPRNMMPINANQLPVPGQKTPLQTERVKSSIPKTNTATTWTYPSPQMFYSSLHRKSKADGVDESLVPLLVTIHNQMNERSWRAVLEWEQLHAGSCAQPSLLKLRGRPSDYSPSAWFRALVLRYPWPFDRHDWVVDRCGTQVRYVLDYYYHAPKPGATAHGPGDGIEVHVRPALDSWQALIDRTRMRLSRALASLSQRLAAGRPPQPTQPTLSLTAVEQPGALERVDEAEFKFLAELTPERVREISGQLRNRCAPYVQEVGQCSDSEACERATMGLNCCLASIVCANKRSAFIEALEHGRQDDIANAYKAMTAALDRFEIQSQRVAMAAALAKQPQPSSPDADESHATS